MDSLNGDFVTISFLCSVQPLFSLPGSAKLRHSPSFDKPASFTFIFLQLLLLIYQVRKRGHEPTEKSSLP